MAKLKYNHVSIEQAKKIVPEKNNWKSIVHSLYDGPIVFNERLPDTLTTHCRNVARLEGITITIRHSPNQTVIALRGQI